MTLAQERDRASTPAHGMDLAAKRENLGRLTEALRALPDAERLAIHLYYLDPDPVRAAESSLGLTRSGFYKLLARARTKLAALLGEEVRR